MIKIVHARSSETKSKYGKAGDQTGAEVCVSNYYDGVNLAVYRATDPAIAEKIVSFMEKCAANKHIGYSQGKERYTLYDALVRFDWNPDKIVEYCNCDCSSLVACACIAAGLNVPKTMTTGTQEKAMKASGAFDILKGDKIVLRRGDIVRRSGHTFVVVDGEQEPTQPIDYAQSRDTKKYKKSFTPRGAAFVRAGASIDAKIIDTVYRPRVLNCYGYYTTDKRGVDWLLVQYFDNSNNIKKGFVSTKAVVLK